MSHLDDLEARINEATFQLNTDKTLKAGVLVEIIEALFQVAEHDKEYMIGVTERILKRHAEEQRLKEKKRV